MLEVWEVGKSIRDVVLSCAALLKNEAAPGLIVLALIISLAGAVFYFQFLVQRRLAAVRALKKLIVTSGSQDVFSQSIDFIEPNLRKKGKSKSLRQVATTWKEYRETFVPHEENGTVIIRNSVRPSVFFNVEDLGFSAGFWRIVPGLFVTIGLFFTFLGLISALGSMDLSADKVEGSLKTLLTIASAKFIMSLTGLLCSILFTIALRIGMGRVEGEVHHLCEVIEDRLSFISLEELAVEQLAATREQREHFRAIGLELVAELGRPFREELPAAISQSISTAMSPLLQQIGQMGADGMGNMVSDLSARFSSDVGRALSQASDRLTEAGDRLGKITEAMASGSGRMGEQMEAAVVRLAEAVADLKASVGDTAQTATGALTEGTDRLLAMMNQTLEQIRDHTRDGAAAMSAAAAEIREAAAGFKSELNAASAEGALAARGQMAAAGSEASKAISGAGETVVAAFGRTAAEIAQATEALSGKASAQLLAPMDDIAARMSRMATDVLAGAENLAQLRDGIRSSADAAERASGAIRAASQDFTAAADPLRVTAVRMGSNVQLLTDTTRKIGDTVLGAAQATAQNASAALAAAQETLGGEHRAIQAALRSVDEMVQRLKGQGDRLDSIDQKLGKAFEDYRNTVEAMVGSLFGHVEKMQEKLEPALDTLREVVEQAEQFVPASRGRG